MGRDVAGTLRWVRAGTALCAEAIGGFATDEDWDTPTLPGWTRRHLVTHLCANAEAIGRLLHWATTGEVTPMYQSMAQRNADIEAGSHRPGPELAAWFTRSSDTLSAAFAAMTEGDWAAEVVTAQGRTVPASETTWMRAREVLVHAVDLQAGIGFGDLPAGFLGALRDEILAKRADEGLPALAGELADVVGYLSGRTDAGVRAADGSPAPQLAPWI